MGSQQILQLEKLLVPGIKQRIPPVTVGQLMYEMSRIRITL